MRPLRFSINVTLDGCCSHEEGRSSEETHRHATETLAEADALIFGRITYGLMEAWRPVAETGQQPEWMADWMMPFAQVIHKAKKYVVSNTLTELDWNAEVVPGNRLEATIRELKAQPGRGLYVGGVMLPLALAKLGLIDDYEFIVHPRIAGRGPTPFAGLTGGLDLKLVDRRQFDSGAVALRYVPRS